MLGFFCGSVLTICDISISLSDSRIESKKREIRKFSRLTIACREDFGGVV